MPKRAVVVATALLILGGAWCQAHAVTAGGGARQLHDLPRSMTGLWGWSKQSCTNAEDDGRVAVGAKSVDFYASSYSLQSIVLGADRTIRATAIVHEEGEVGASEGAIQLKLRSKNRLWIHTDSGLDNVYTRCAAGS